MPYQIKQEGDQYCVYNVDSGKKMGEFDSRRLAMAKMKALYANDKGESESAAEDKAEGGKEE